MQIVIWIAIAVIAAFAGLVILWAYTARWIAKALPGFVTRAIFRSLVKRFVRANELVPRLELKSGMRLLLVGKHTGSIAFPSAQELWPSGEVVFIDPDLYYIEEINLELQKRGIGNVRVQEADLLTAAFGPASFDRIVLVGIRNTGQDIGQVLEMSFNLLKPGGLLSVTEMSLDVDYVRVKSLEVLAGWVGFKPRIAYEGRLSYTHSFQKPVKSATTDQL